MSSISGYALPEVGAGAEMISGSLDDQVEKVASLLKEKGFK